MLVKGAPGRCVASIWTDAGSLLTRLLGIKKKKIFTQQNGFENGGRFVSYSMSYILYLMYAYNFSTKPHPADIALNHLLEWFVILETLSHGSWEITNVALNVIYGKIADYRQDNV